jgi:hypothetical protein
MPNVRSVLAPLCAGVAVVLWPGAATAQRCSADVQCPNAGRSTFLCLGDTLIVKRSLCSGGACREVEERRKNCGSRIGGTVTCAGNTAIRVEGGCNSALGTCDTRTDREVCVASCACRKNRLYIATGVCITGSGCARAVIQCKSGCTCSPEPRCL